MSQNKKNEIILKILDMMKFSFNPSFMLKTRYCNISPDLFVDEYLIHQDRWRFRRDKKEIYERYVNQKRTLNIEDELCMIPYFEVIHLFPDQFLSDDKKIIVDGWKTAYDYGVAKTYFGKNDVLGITKDECVDVTCYSICDYKGDYDVFLKTLDMKKKMDYYKRYLDLNSAPVPLGRNEYESPLTFVQTWRAQEGEYRDVIQHIDTNDDFQIYSDGLGAVSMICIEASLVYESNEPNRIGWVAKMLGIINTNNFIPDDDKIKLFFNCVKYYDVKGLKGGVVIYDEDRLFDGYEDYTMYPLSGGLLWFRGVRIRPGIRFFKHSISTALPMIKDKKNVPLDPKAEMYLVLSKLQVYDAPGISVLSRNVKHNGEFFVTCKENDKCFCLRTRSNIADMTFGKKGDLKCLDGVFFTYHGPFLFSGEDFVKKIEFRSYDDPYLLRQYILDKGFIVGAHPRPETVRYMYDTSNNRQRLVFIKSLDNEGLRYGVYKLFNDVYEINKEVIGFEDFI